MPAHGALSRWVPAGRHPLPTDHDGDYVVDLQGRNCGATARRPADDAGTIRAPPEMASPDLTPRVENSRPMSGRRIAGIDLRAFVAVTQAACQPEIVLDVCTASGHW